jgi:hypothetical protein
MRQLGLDLLGEPEKRPRRRPQTEIKEAA